MTQATETIHAHEAIDYYNLSVDLSQRDASPLHQTLEADGIAQIDMPLTETDFTTLTTTFDACIDECPNLLQDSFFHVDDRRGHAVGYVRKDKKINAVGVQIEDPKSYFHFSEAAHDVWREQYRTAPRMLRDFLAAGLDIQNVLTAIARKNVTDLEPTHPNIGNMYYPGGQSLGFMRVLSYDGYIPSGKMSPVAKPHYDLGGFTIQAYADAAGFWGARGGPQAPAIPYDTTPGKAFTFLGKEHDKVYGEASPLSALWHGVERIIPEDTAFVPRRHAVILFSDAPHVNHRTNAADTLPHIYGNKAVA